MDVAAFDSLIPYPKDGKDGIGERGPLPYPAGIFQSDVSYTATKDKTPIVYYKVGKTFYVMNKVATVKGLNPADDYAKNGTNATWIPFENYKAVFTEILMAEFAKLASAVFWGDYMFSQYGRDSEGKITEDYSKFGTSSFSPRLQINFKTGDIYCESLIDRGSNYNKLTAAKYNDQGNFITNWGVPYAGNPDTSNYIYNTRSGAITAMVPALAVLNPDGTVFYPHANAEFMMVQRYAGGASDILTISTIGQISVMLNGIYCKDIELYPGTFVKFLYKRVPEEGGAIRCLIINSGDFNIVTVGLSQKVVAKHRSFS